MVGVTKESIRRIVQQEPGVTTRRVAEAAGVDESTACYHLRKLEKEKLVVAEAVGRATCWFAAESRFCPVLRRAIPAMSRAEVRLVAREAGPEPRPLCAVARATGLREGGVRWARDVLGEAGLFERARNGRLQLAPGAALCVSRALAAEPCDRWGECPVSRAWEQRQAALPVTSSRRSAARPGRS